MATVQLRNVIQLRSGLPKDVAVNTFSVIAADTSEGSRTEMFNAVQSFFNTAHTSPVKEAVAWWLSPAVSRESLATRTEMYVVDPGTGLSGSPIAIANWTLAAGPTAVTDILPNECSVCASWAAGAPAGVNPQRRKGRVFIGPLRDLACEADPTTTQPRVASTCMDSIQRASLRLGQQLVADGHALAVWSRTDGAFYPVVRGWVDAEFDTQRRRSNVATMRLPWALG